MWKVEKFSVERKEMSQKIQVEFVTDWKKVDADDCEQAEGGEERIVVQEVFLKIRENKNESLTATAKERKCTAVYISCKA